LPAYRYNLNRYIPEALIPVLLKVRKLWRDEYALQSYSQEGEDLILRRLFERQENGFYVDIGAHHPKRFSNTYIFYRKGWRGINVDARPGAMEAFKKYRPRDINLEVAISENVEELTYYEFNEPALNGFSEELAHIRDNTERYRIVSTKKITAMPLAGILDQYLPDGQKIDFMSIDVEGWESRVLNSNDWSRFQPKIILVEIGDSDLENLGSNVIASMLRSNGYMLYAKCVNTWIFRLRSWQNASGVF
jgi:FkbM family methyltransferase